MNRTITRALVTATIASALALSACAGRTADSPSPSPSPSPSASASATPSPSPSWTPEPEPLSDLSLGLESFASGFDHPVFLTSRPLDYRTYVVEQPGRVLALSADGSLRRVVLDIRDRVLYSGERGLLSVAFDPKYPWRMFVDYTGAGGTTVVEEYRFPLDSWEADPTPVRTILTQAQPYANHNGGQLAFGPDGYLYIGFGDGGSGGDPQGNGQNTATLLGSIVRVDISTPDGYVVPADNPFADGAGGRPEIWVYGVRNPWRFSFDGDWLYIADVGQNRMEEIDVVDATTAAGSNFGWNRMEGTLCYPSGKGCAGASYGFVDPAFAYRQDEDHGLCSVTGGYVYRGTDFPGLWGTYVYSDFCGGGIFGLRTEAGKVTETRAFGVAASAVSSFGTDAEGNLYIVSLSGTVYRIVDGAKK